MKGLQRLLRFFVEHNDVIVEVTKWDKREFGGEWKCIKIYEYKMA